MAPIVEVRHLSKVFRLRTIKATTLKERLLVHLWKFNGHRELRALDDLSFEVERGRTLGILGSNGSGKSTLLRVLAGVTPATSGQVAVRGRTSSLIDLTAGLQAELSGIENIFLNASVLGLSRSESRRRLSAIVDFAELGHYIHSPVKYYSSGMLLRLAFSIAAHLDPEVLLVDEALAVGDAYFQAKSLDRMRQLRNTRETTILLVTHNVELVEEMCDEVLWIEKGRLRYRGTRAEGLDQILMEHHRHVGELDRMALSHELMHLLLKGRFGTGEVVIRSVRFLNRDGRETCTFHPGDRFCAEIDYEMQRPIEAMMCGVGIEREDGLTCTLGYSSGDLFGPGPIPPRGTIRAVLDPFDFLPGRYRFSVGLSVPGRPAEVYDLHLLLYMICVVGDESEAPGDAAFSQRAEFAVAGR
jgi:ABC-type polysaccharide/polyol phosphate transport system ATPase subunit